MSCGTRTHIETCIVNGKRYKGAKKWCVYLYRDAKQQDPSHMKFSVRIRSYVQSSNFSSEASHLWSPKDRIKSQKILVLIGFMFSEFWHSINFVLSLISNKQILLHDYNEKKYALHVSNTFLWFYCVRVCFISDSEKNEKRETERVKLYTSRP